MYIYDITEAISKKQRSFHKNAEDNTLKMQSTIH